MPTRFVLNLFFFIFQQVMPKKPQNHRKKQNNFVTFLIIALLLTAIYTIFNPTGDSSKIAGGKKVGINEITKAYNSSQLEEIKIRGVDIIAKTKEGVTLLSTRFPNETLNDLGWNSPNISTEVLIVDDSGDAFWAGLVSSILPFIIILGIIIFMMKQMSKTGGMGPLAFGKSRAKVYQKKPNGITFEDVAGAQEAKSDLEEIVDFLKNPKKYTKIGAKIPKGVLLVGAPGTGKTLLARAVAGEANVPFFSISGSEFVEMFVGVGASRVRDLFEKAKRSSPCIIFIDEIDAVGRQRGHGMGGGHDEREQTLNQILTEMDGFDTNTAVIVLAATNRPDVLDKALLRPGRFDRQVVIDLPDLKAREEILIVHKKGKPVEQKTNFKKVASHTPGFSGADLANIMNEAAITTAAKNRKKITQQDIEASIEKVMMGAEKRSRVLSKKELEITAFHETGHAVISHLLPGCDPVHKVSIVPRGQALGVTWMLPEQDIHLYPQSKFEDEICSLLGGYVAEKITFGEVATGASNDLQRASNIARQMVTKYGMSNLGAIIFGVNSESNYLGVDLGSTRNYSEVTAEKVDNEVKKIIDAAFKKTETLIKKWKKEIDIISNVLLKKESINAAQFLTLIKVPKSRYT